MMTTIRYTDTEMLDWLEQSDVDLCQGIDPATGVPTWCTEVKGNQSEEFLSLRSALSNAMDWEKFKRSSGRSGLEQMIAGEKS
jgi:hypothetical protein